MPNYLEMSRRRRQLVQSTPDAVDGAPTLSAQVVPPGTMRMPSSRPSAVVEQMPSDVERVAEEVLRRIQDRLNHFGGGAYVNVADADSVFYTRSGVSRSAGAIFGDVINVKNPPFNAVGDGVTSDATALNTMHSSVASGSFIFFPPGTYYIPGATAEWVITKSLTILFAAGAKLKFDHHTSGYAVKISGASDVVMIDPTIEMVSSSRTVSSCIKVTDDSSRVRLVRPKILDSSGAGIIVEDATDVQIDNPYVEDTRADGIHITNGGTLSNITRRVTVTSPICVSTGDDAVSVVSYTTATELVEDVTITGAISLDSAAAGFVCAGGRRVRYDGDIYSPAARGVRVERDSSVGTHDVFSCNVRANVYDSGTDGLRVGIDVFDSDFDVNVFNAGSRGVSFGSGNATDIPMRIRLNAMVYTSASIGIDIDGVDGLACGILYAENAASTGIALVGTTHNVSIGALVAKNNNTSATASVDNITIIDDATGAPTNITIGAGQNWCSDSRAFYPHERANMHPDGIVDLHRAVDVAV